MGNRRTLEELTSFLFQFQGTTMGWVTSEDADGVRRGGAICLWFQECIHNRQALSTRPTDNKNKFRHGVFSELRESGFGGVIWLHGFRLLNHLNSVNVGLLPVGLLDLH